MRRQDGQQAQRPQRQVVDGGGGLKRLGGARACRLLDQHVLALEECGRDGGNQRGIDAERGKHPRAQRAQAQAAQQGEESGRHDAAALQAQAAVSTGLDPGIGCACRGDFLLGRLHPDRGVAQDFSAFDDRGDVRADPVVVAVLTPVLHQPNPHFALADGLPQVGERLLGHVRMAHDAVRCADQLFAGVPADLDEGLGRIGDIAVQIRAREKVVVFSDLEFFSALRLKLVVFFVHQSLRETLQSRCGTVVCRQRLKKGWLDLGLAASCGGKATRHTRKVNAFKVLLLFDVGLAALTGVAVQSLGKL
ncbi:hypothetical protein D3C78_945590 [compost metagenome]